MRVNGKECTDLFLQVFKHTSAQMIIVDLEGKIIAVNEAKQRSSDRHAEIGMCMYVDYAAGHVVADMHKELMNILVHGGSKNFPECPYREKVLSITITGMLGVGAIIVSEDITRLKKSEERLRMLVNGVPGMAVQGYKLDGTIFLWNKASELLYGYAAEEAIGRNLLDTIIPPDMRDAVTQGMQYMVDTGQSIPSGELALMRRDGTLVQVYSSHVLLTNSDGDSELFCVDIDLTERREAEEHLRESEMILRAITEAAQDAIIAMDSSGSVSFWNPAAQRILGYSAEEAIGQPLHDLIAPENCREQYRQGIEHFRKTGNGPAMGKTTDREVKCKDGNIISIQLSLAPVQINGEWHSVGVLRDVTEQKIAEQNLRESEERSRVMSMTDQLTGLFNRWHFSFELQREVDRAERYGLPLTVIMFDLDDFKAFNESYGHAAGDRVLQILGHVVQGSLRKNDIPCRIGGEEFFIILPMTNQIVAQAIAFRISMGLKAHVLDFAPEKKITFSCGVYQYDGGQSPDELSRCVDKLVQQAKAEGKDRICCV